MASPDEPTASDVLRKALQRWLLHEDNKREVMLALIEVTKDRIYWLDREKLSEQQALNNLLRELG